MNNEPINGFGFRQQRGGAHLARTIMLQELKLLFSFNDTPDADKDMYLRSIVEDNCLNKRSEKTRKLTARHLVNLYGLDTNITLFRSFRYFWDRDKEGQPLLALLVAVARDSVLKSSVPFIQNCALGQRLKREAIEAFLDDLETGRFSPATLNWLGRQKQDITSGVDGAQEKLAAAESLQKKLELILEGEAPYDIFVRWKPVEKQPLGWNPDLNDGVRLNIRPFMTVGDVKKKGAGVLRDKPNIKWGKDRGKDVESAPWYHLFNGDRINDHHLTLERKLLARAKTKARKGVDV